MLLDLQHLEAHHAARRTELDTALRDASAALDAMPRRRAILTRVRLPHVRLAHAPLRLRVTRRVGRVV